jgi:hypothetical protein
MRPFGEQHPVHTFAFDDMNIPQKTPQEEKSTKKNNGSMEVSPCSPVAV